jgi:hypothetical protein
MSKKTAIFDQVRQQAKKMTLFGVRSAQKMTKEPVEKFQLNQDVGQIVEGQAYQRGAFDVDYRDVQQLFRHQFPNITQQLLGKRYHTVNKISHLVLPNGMDQAADEILELLNEFAGNWATTEKVLSATGCKAIQELQHDPERSYRAGNALKEMTKIFAAVQGGVSGMLGLVGSAIDLPISVILSLKTIYEIGRVYGFELDNEEDCQAVYHVLAQADLGLIAEKQVIFLGLRTLKQVLHTGDYQQLQNFFNSHYTIEQFHHKMTDDEGNYKWAALNILNKMSILKYATPLLSGAVGVLYNVRLIDEVAEQAHEIFSHARTYLLQHQEQDISVLEAYYRAQAAKVQLLPEMQDALSSIAPIPTEHSVEQTDTTGIQQQAVMTEQMPVEQPDVVVQHIEDTPKVKMPRKRRTATSKTATNKTSTRTTKEESDHQD